MFDSLLWLSYENERRVKNLSFLEINIKPNLKIGFRTVQENQCAAYLIGRYYRDVDLGERVQSTVLIPRCG